MTDHCAMLAVSATTLDHHVFNLHGDTPLEGRLPGMRQAHDEVPGCGNSVGALQVWGMLDVFTC